MVRVLAAKPGGHWFDYQRLPELSCGVHVYVHNVGIFGRHGQLKGSVCGPADPYHEN